MKEYLLFSYTDLNNPAVEVIHAPLIPAESRKSHGMSSSFSQVSPSLSHPIVRFPSFAGAFQILNIAYCPLQNEVAVSSYIFKGLIHSVPLSLLFPTAFQKPFLCLTLSASAYWHVLHFCSQHSLHA